MLNLLYWPFPVQVAASVKHSWDLFIQCRGKENPPEMYTFCLYSVEVAFIKAFLLSLSGQTLWLHPVTLSDFHVAVIQVKHILACQLWYQETGETQPEDVLYLWKGVCE